MALNILEEFELSTLGHNSPDYCHFVLEAMKLAFADCHSHVTDPEAETIPTERLLSKALRGGTAESHRLPACAARCLSRPLFIR